MNRINFDDDRFFTEDDRALLDVLVSNYLEQLSEDRDPKQALFWLTPGDLVADAIECATDYPDDTYPGEVSDLRTLSMHLDQATAAQK